MIAYVATEGYASAEASFQGAVTYAKDRLQFRAMTGIKNPNGPADPIIVHPDVRRMLLTQKAIAEGGRALCTDLFFSVDKVEKSDDSDVISQENNKLALLTPIAKGFLTELGVECTSLGIQVYGGHGFIKEWGMEQLLRDTKINCIYEGTTGIQALDLLSRKIIGSEFKLVNEYLSEMVSDITLIAERDDLMQMASTLIEQINQIRDINQSINSNVKKNPDEIGAASVDYLMMMGYVVLGFYWLSMANKAYQILDKGTDESEFYHAKVITAQFYIDRILPRADGHRNAIRNGANSMMALKPEHFIF